MPQIVVFVILAIASVGATISGLGRSSRAFLPDPTGRGLSSPTFIIVSNRMRLLAATTLQHAGVIRHT